MKFSHLLMKTCLSLLMFVLAVRFEEASSERLTLLILVFSLFIGWGLMRPFLGNRTYLFFVDGILLYSLEYQSKFVINYFLHSLYILIILEAAISLSRKQIHPVAAFLSLISLSKFAYLLIYQWNARSISEFLFNLFALLFIVTLIHYTLLQREEKQRNQELYHELLQTHRQLKQYMLQAEQTAILEERNRIAREIHDSVGHQMTSLILQLEMCSLHLDKEAERVHLKELLNKAKETARFSLSEIRKAVNALQGEETGGLASILKLAERFRQESGVAVNMQITDQAKNLSLTPIQSFVLYRIIQEAMTNALRHAHAERIEIFLNTDGRNRLCFVISNPYSFSGPITEGFGLKNMRSRIESLKGEIRFTNDEGLFRVSGHFPLNL